MANQKLTQLTAASSANDGDIFYFVTDTGGTPAGLKISKTNLFKGYADTGLLLGKVGTDTTIVVYYPISGGGTLNTSRLLQIDTAFLVNTARTLNTTYPLSGGGNLSADRTITIDTAFLLNSGSTILNGKVGTDTTIIVYYPLSGGGALNTSRLLQIDTAFLVNSGSNLFASSGASFILFGTAATVDGNLNTKKFLAAGTNVTVTTNASTVWVNATGGGGSENGFILLPVQAVKLETANSVAIDGGETNWRLLFDDTTNEDGYWQFVTPQEYGGDPQIRILHSMRATSVGTVSVAVSVMSTSPDDQVDTNTESYDSVNTAQYTVAAPGSAGFLYVLTIPLVYVDNMTGGDLTKIKLMRDATGSYLADTTSGDWEVLGVALEYTRV